MKRLVVITQHLDGHRGLMPSFVGWIRELARWFDRVDVIALEKGSFLVPDNVRVYSLGKERGSTKIVRIIRLLYFLSRTVPGSVGVFAHMSPIFAIIAWPFTFLFRAKLFLWYLHRSDTSKLRLATWLSDGVITADKDSLSMKGDRVIEVGHGIDANRFATTRTWDGSSGNTAHIIHVGRISPIKNIETLIRAAYVLHTKLHNEVKLTIIGDPVMPLDIAYLKKLKDLVQTLQLSDFVSFAGYVHNEQLPVFYAEANIAVGLTQPGGIDKAILEAMASGCLTLTSNSVLKKYFGQYADLLTFQYTNFQELADKIHALVRCAPEKKKEISEFLVKSVQTHHTTEGAVKQIADLFL